jgi:hypothetical protein
MRVLGLVLSSLVLVACSGTTPTGSFQAGIRYQQITNPPAIFCPATNGNTMPEPGCGLVILDTQTGTIFIHRATDWQEEDPHTGKIAIHDLH